MSGFRDTSSALPTLEVAPRLARLRDRMRQKGYDALLVTSLPNVRYLTGFTGSAAVLAVTAETACFVTDGRYRTQAAEQLASAGVADAVALAIGTTAAQQDDIVGDAVAECATLALEDHIVTWAQQRKYAERLPRAEVVPAGTVVEDLRRIKDAAEVARIRAACAIADDAFAELAPTLAAGPTERDFALDLEMAMRRRGATAVSFDPIVAGGPNAAKPHARPSDRPIGRGELVVVDFGCIVDGYCSDMTRTVSVGDPGARSTEIWEVVRAAQAAGRDAVRPGAACADVDGAARSVIDGAGLGEHFTHSTGHGVGLEIHEEPRVSAVGAAVLAVGDVVTVEPGVYLPGTGGVRIEDTFVVTPGGADPLTLTPKELVL